jgi:hypothetical protein
MTICQVYEGPTRATLLALDAPSARAETPTRGTHEPISFLAEWLSK